VSGPEPTKTEYHATEEAHAAVVQLARNPLATSAVVTSPRGAGPLALTGSLYVIAYNDLQSSSTFLEGGIAGSYAGDCSGDDAYKDLREGTSVMARDDSGRVLANGTLGQGKGGTLSGGEPGSDLERLGQDAFTCTFPFQLETLPKVCEYSIEVSDMGEVSFSKAELQRLGWEVDLSVSPYSMSDYATPAP
jgi:hypothetical protein